MTQSLHPAAQQGFSQAAELYQQVRPDYPPQVVNWLKDDLKLQPSSNVVDLGAGTGKFLPYLQQLGVQLTAVEPVAKMLAQLQQQYPQVRALAGSSQQIPLPGGSQDAIVCAQAFHWFADIGSLNEIYQVLKPQGYLGLVWNQRDVEVDWVKALAEQIAPLEGHTPRYHSGQWKAVFEHQFLFQLEKVRVFSQLHRGSVEQVVSRRLLSTSFIAALPEAQQQQLKAQFEATVYQYTGKQPHDDIAFPYITYAYSFRKMGSAEKADN